MKIVKLVEVIDIYSGQIMSRVKADKPEATGVYVATTNIKVINKIFDFLFIFIHPFF